MVAMVILVIAAIAIPSFVQARMKANEASAVLSMKTINTAEILYAQTYPDIGFTSHLPDLGANGSSCDTPDSRHACIIMDDALASGFKSGYVFELSGDGAKPSFSYTSSASPASAGVSGRCSFGSSQSGDITMIVLDGAGSSRFAVGSSGTCDH